MANGGGPIVLDTPNEDYVDELQAWDEEWVTRFVVLVILAADEGGCNPSLCMYQS